MTLNIVYTCPKNITSFSQCEFPEGVTHVYCRNNQIKSFQYLPATVSYISCYNNQINSFKYLPGSVRWIYCQDNQINSFKYLPGSVREICCQNNQINSFQYLPDSVREIYCFNNPCQAEIISKGLPQIHQANKDRNIDNWKSGISKLRYMRLNYLIHSIWKRYWYDQRDTQGYSRACRHLASKNCPNGFLILEIHK